MPARVIMLPTMRIERRGEPVRRLVQCRVTEHDYELLREHANQSWQGNIQVAANALLMAGIRTAMLKVRR